TAGSEYSSIFGRTGDSSTLSTPHVKVADTVGAGDSFSGTFTSNILQGVSLRTAHRAAVHTAAYVCTQNGAWPDYPETIPDYLAQAEAEN
ncbi:MAG: PfkB family carbohydrate kinase, partial [Bifidobacterium crudilactis]|nr:PfkB family carbohydrate kinase [Bifidobacterium crudilactis]